MLVIHIYTKSYCAYCSRAKELLDIKGVAYTEFDITDDPKLETLMRQRSGDRTVPQIFIGAQHIGGCDELFTLDEQEQLDPLLETI